MIGTTSNAMVLVNGFDLSDHVQKVRVSTWADLIDITQVNSACHTVAKGLVQSEVAVTFFQDFAASEVHQVLSPLVGSSTPVSVEVRPVKAPASDTNPAATLNALLMDYRFVDVAVGDVSPVDAVFVGVAPIGVGMFSFPDSPSAYPDLLVPA